MTVTTIDLTAQVSRKWADNTNGNGRRDESNDLSSMKLGGRLRMETKRGQPKITDQQLRFRQQAGQDVSSFSP